MRSADGFRCGRAVSGLLFNQGQGEKCNENMRRDARHYPKGVGATHVTRYNDSVNLTPQAAKKELLTSDDVNRAIDELLLSGRAQTMSEAENLFLDEHLDEISRLVTELDEQSFRDHEAIKLLMSHGSRSWEDGAL